jgi:hypothetical protein
MRLQVNPYSLRSWKDSETHHPKTWTAEGSMDGNNWLELDCQTNQSELLGINKSATFSTSAKQFIPMIRLRQTGKNSMNYDHLTVCAFEVFGTIRDLADDTSVHFFFSLHIGRMLCNALNGNCVEVQCKSQFDQHRTDSRSSVYVGECNSNGSRWWSANVALL